MTAKPNRPRRKVRPKRRPGPARTRRPPRQGSGADPFALVDDLTVALETGEPLIFLGLVSTMLAAAEPRRPQPLRAGDPPGDQLTMAAITASFTQTVSPGTTAVLAALAVLAGDEHTRDQARRAAASRPHELPDWLARLSETSVDKVVEATHALGDRSILLVGAGLAGRDLTMIVSIDHNIGTAVADGYGSPDSIDQVSGLLSGAESDLHWTYKEISPADARARLDPAIELGAIMFPPLETETWPASRPLAQWLARLMPEGGTGYERPEWSEADLAKLTERFFSSDLGRELDDAGHRTLLEELLWFGTDYGPGDPLRWSPDSVQILLADWIPRKIVAEADLLARAPALLRRFIRFCHRERRIRRELTKATLAAVDELEPEYQRVIRTDRPQGPEALIEAMDRWAEGE